MAAGDLTTTSDVKAWIGKADAGADTVLARLVTEASQWITDFCERSFFSASYSEIRHGSGGVELFLAQPLVTAVSSVAVNAIAIPAQSADGQPGYFLVDQRVLALQGYLFTSGRNNVRVTYTAGPSSVPTDIAQACIELVADRYARGRRGDPSLRSKGIGVSAESMQWSAQEVPQGVLAVLRRYADVVPA